MSIDLTNWANSFYAVENELSEYQGWLEFYSLWIIEWVICMWGNAWFDALISGVDANLSTVVVNTSAAYDACMNFFKWGMWQRNTRGFVWWIDA